LHEETVHLAVDMMSGDSGLRLTVPAALQALSDYPQVFLHLMGEQTSLNNLLAEWPEALRSRARICHAPELVNPGDSLAAVLRRSKNSSIHAGFDALESGGVAAVISAGHAGILMALGKKVIGMTPGFARPALCALFPTARGFSVMLDLGANVDCTARQLYDFAILGGALFNSLNTADTPRLGLLSNGEEPGKGNAAARQAAVLLQANPAWNYGGYVEASALHDGNFDVVVCDGFTGNIALKAIEGTAELARRKLTALIASPGAYGISQPGSEQLLTDFAAQMDHESHSGAFLLGLNGIVVKAHGNSSSDGFAAAIGCALKCEERNMIANMKTQLASADVQLN
jgi:glycerol-3-phosphate acyltransferase PlsX